MLSNEECQKILNRSVESPARFVSYQTRNFHDNVAGFLSEALLLTINYTTNNKPSQTTYFMKILPRGNDNQLNYVRDAGIFKKEVLLYKNLLSELLNVARFGPKCYFTRDDCIILENLNNKGFTMLAKENCFNSGQCEDMLETLAKFHASTIIYESKKGVRIDAKFKNEIQETSYSFTTGHPRQLWCISTTKTVVDLLESASIQNAASVGAKFTKFVLEEFPTYIQPSKRFRNVFTHDDLWCNNMLFSNKNGCLFVDYQMGRYTPPALDFLQCLYLTMDWDFLVNNFKALTDTYYKYLVQELKPHSLEHELTKNEFLESLEFYKLAALTECVMYGTHVFISEELGNKIVSDFEIYKEFSFVNRSKYAVREYKNNSQFRTRIRNLLISLSDRLAEK